MKKDRDLPEWRRVLRRGVPLRRVTQQFVRRRDGTEPTQKRLVESHQTEMRGWKRMTRYELKLQLLANQEAARITAGSPDYRGGGGNVSHHQWRINVLKQLISEK